MAASKNTIGSEAAIGPLGSSATPSCSRASGIGATGVRRGERGDQIIQLVQQRLVSAARVRRELFRIERQVEEK